MLLLLLFLSTVLGDSPVARDWTTIEKWQFSLDGTGGGGFQAPVEGGDQGEQGDGGGDAASTGEADSNQTASLISVKPILTRIPNLKTPQTTTSPLQNLTEEAGTNSTVPFPRSDPFKAPSPADPALIFDQVRALLVDKLNELKKRPARNCPYPTNGVGALPGPYPQFIVGGGGVGNYATVNSAPPPTVITPASPSSLPSLGWLLSTFAIFVLHP